ncbi:MULTISPECIES: BID domain-containing T4SS effector [Bartonella]|uniref:BID domain-containing T4SS effector n=1 Tax=Bartonella TaxID=773 RepID=UPI0023602645|nr:MULTISPECIES: BID domain-containing T4SS effector [Bartonella]
MKKSHPHPSENPEALYATVNKPNRGGQRRPNPEEEVVYASVSTVDPLSRGRRPDQGRENPETDYTEVAPPRREAEVTYASVSSVSPSRGRHHAQGQQESETDYTEVAPQQRGRPSSSLTAEQMSVMLLKNPQVQAYGEEVMHWGQIVYGNDKLFQQHLQGILTDPGKGKELSNQLAEDPESIHKLAGRSALGLKSQARKEAEEGFRPLIEAIDGYTKAVENATEKLSRTPQAEQKRHQENRQQTEGHHRHHRHHERGQEQNSPEHSPQRQRHGEKGMAYAM